MRTTAQAEICFPAAVRLTYCGDLVIIFMVSRFGAVLPYAVNCSDT